MQTIRWILIAYAFLVPFALPSFIPSESAHAEALDLGFTQQQIDDARQYSLERRLLFWSSTLIHLALLVTLVVHSRRLADAGQRWFGQYWWLPTVLFLGLLLLLAEEVVNLPFGLARLEHLRQWELTNQSQLDWLGQHFLSLALYAGIQAVVLVLFYLLLRYFPRSWWLLASLGMVLLSIVIAYLLPVVISPLFNTFTPLSATKWKHLEPMVQQLLARKNIQVQDVLVVDASRQSGHTNAYFTGFGPTRRIMLYDTLLEKHTDAEVESVLGHEIGHWVHNHIVKGIALGAAAILVGFFLLHRILLWLRGRSPWRLRDAADPAGLPLMVFMGFFTSWLILPVEHSFSRYIERQADVMSLELSGNPAVFIATEKKMALDNLANLTPNPLAAFLYNTHPTTAQRIRMAQQWQNPK